MTTNIKNGKYVEHGCESWFRHGLRHREDGPAYISSDVKLWVVNGEWHRIDGPAYMVTDDGSYNEWYVDDKRYTSNSKYQKAVGLSDEEMTMLVLKYGDIV